METSQTVIGDFTRFFAACSRLNIAPIMVGGHAVYLWAETLLSLEEQVIYKPFVSKDLDVIGTKFEAVALARDIDLISSQIYVNKERIPFDVVIASLELPGSKPLKVEFLSRLWNFLEIKSKNYHYNFKLVSITFLLSIQ